MQRHGDEQEIVAEIMGEARVVLDSVYIPPERRGIYLNEELALKFGDGRIIQDECPFQKIVVDAKDPKFEEQMIREKRQHFEGTVKKL